MRKNRSRSFDKLCVNFFSFLLRDKSGHYRGGPGDYKNGSSQGGGGGGGGGYGGEKYSSSKKKGDEYYGGYGRR